MNQNKYIMAATVAFHIMPDTENQLMIFSGNQYISKLFSVYSDADASSAMQGAAC